MILCLKIVIFRKNRLRFRCGLGVGKVRAACQNSIFITRWQSASCAELGAGGVRGAGIFLFFWEYILRTRAKSDKSTSAPRVRNPTLAPLAKKTGEKFADSKKKPYLCSPKLSSTT